MGFSRQKYWSGLLFPSPGDLPNPGIEPRSLALLLLLLSRFLILGRPLLLLLPIPPNIKVFSSVSTLHMRCPKCWSFSFSIILSKEIPGLISFRMD